jgi:hypothetical protein
MEIKPIETVYNGYRFRSRLEARWAVFFDALKIKYEYEKEGYDLGGLGYYLPDFWLPEYNCFIEIKGNVPSTKERAKAEKLFFITGDPCIIFYGLPFDNYGIVYCATDHGDSSGGAFYSDKVCWVKYRKVPEIDIQANDHYVYNLHTYEGIPGFYYNSGSTVCNPDEAMYWEASKFKDAINAAKSARFEHGEKPDFITCATPIKNNTINLDKSLFNFPQSWEKDVFGCTLDEEWDRVMDREERHEKHIEEKLKQYSWVNKPDGIPDELFCIIMDEACSYEWWGGDVNEKIKDEWWSKIIEANRDNKAFYGENSFL